MEYKITGGTVFGECVICDKSTDWIGFVSDINKKPKYVGWFYKCEAHTMDELREFVYNEIKQE